MTPIWYLSFNYKGDIIGIIYLSTKLVSYTPLIYLMPGEKMRLENMLGSYFMGITILDKKLGLGEYFKYYHEYIPSLQYRFSPNAFMVTPEQIFQIKIKHIICHLKPLTDLKINFLIDMADGMPATTNPATNTADASADASADDTCNYCSIC